MFPNKQIYSKISLLFYVLLITYSCSSQTNTGKSPQPDQNPKLEVPKIYLGENLFVKKQIFQNNDSTTRHQIIAVSTGSIDEKGVTNIIVAGRENVYILGFDGILKREFKYKFADYSKNTEIEADSFALIEIKDFDGDGNLDIIGQHNLIAGIVNYKGDFVWKYKDGGEYGFFQDLVVEDIDDDGKNEVIAITLDYIEVFDQAGKLIWKKDLAVKSEKKFSISAYDTQIADFVGDSKKEILVGKTIFDNSGNFIKTTKVPRFLGFLKSKDGKPLLTTFENNQLNLLDIEGNIKEKYNSPLSNLKRDFIIADKSGFALSETKFIRAKLKNENEDWLVVLAAAFDYELYDNFQMLYIYNGQGKLIYQETIKALISDIAVLPNEDKTDSLLISKDKILELYRVK